jgi:Kef-type K+ transport system membrane component KefB
MHLLLVVLAALAGGWAARRLGYPSILGELMAGILLGPPLLGLLETDDALAVIGKVGVVLLMLYIGLHLDPADLGKAAKPGALAALGGFLVPAGLGFGLMMWLDGDAIAASFVAVAMGVTSLATKSRILVDLGILNTRIAHVLMAGALFSDVAALIFFAALLGLAATGTIAAGTVAMTALKAALFLVGTWLVGRYLFPVVGRLLTRYKTDESVVFLVVIAAGLAFAAAADAAGLHAILGAFLAGLYVREGILPHNTLVEVERRTRNISVGLLAPVFFVTAGFKVSFDVFTEAPLLLAGVVVLATVGKLLGTALFYLPTGFGFREGIAVGAGMNGRGAVEIIVAEIALAAGLIDATVFSILVFMAIFTTATVPVLLTRSIEWLRRRGELTAEDREDIIIIGADAVARQLGSLLGQRSPVTVIDTNVSHGTRASELGLQVVIGSGLDEDVLEQAGARSARMLVAVTANAEVNLLAANLATSRFGVPEVYVSLASDSASGMFEMLDDIGGELLFGRPIDIAAWDADLDQGRLDQLDYEVVDPETMKEHNGSADLPDKAVATLSLAVVSEAGIKPFSPGVEIGDQGRVRALGRKSPESTIQEPSKISVD